MQYAQLNPDGTFGMQLPEGNHEFSATCFQPAGTLSEDEAALYCVVPLTPIAAPAHNALTQTCYRDGSELVNGAWQYKWAVSDLPADIAAKNVIDDVVKHTQARLDDFARQRAYDDVNSISKYQAISDTEIAALPVDQQALVTKFRQECRYVAIGAARTWASLYTLLAEVQAGTRAMPTSFVDVEPLLPPLAWPA